jgi:hypothetical protein
MMVPLVAVKRGTVSWPTQSLTPTKGGKTVGAVGPLMNGLLDQMTFRVKIIRVWAGTLSAATSGRRGR